MNFEKKSVGWEDGSTSVSDVRNAAIFSPQPFTIDTGEKFGALLFRLALTRGLVLSNDFEISVRFLIFFRVAALKIAEKPSKFLTKV